MKPRMPKKQLAQLREAIRVAEMAQFATMDPKRADQIREETRLYRETWLLPQLRSLLTWGEGK